MTRAIWRSLRIFNSHFLVERYAKETGNKGVYLAQSANDGSRVMMGVLTGYRVVRPGFLTDPEARRTRGNKEFSTFEHEYDWAKTLEAAAKWTRERYGVGEFVAIPGFGRDRFPAEIAEWAKQTLKTAKAQQKED